MVKGCGDSRRRVTVSRRDKGRFVVTLPRAESRRGRARGSPARRGQFLADGFATARGRGSKCPAWRPAQRADRAVARRGRRDQRANARGGAAAGAARAGAANRVTDTVLLVSRERVARDGSAAARDLYERSFGISRSSVRAGALFGLGSSRQTREPLRDYRAPIPLRASLAEIPQPVGVRTGCGAGLSELLARATGAPAPRAAPEAPPHRGGPGQVAVAWRRRRRAGRRGT